MNHHVPQMAAAIAYYMIFSLPAILLITISIGGYLARIGALGTGDTVREHMIDEVGGVVGSFSTDQVAQLIDRATKLPPSTSSVLFVTAMLFFSASGVIVQVQIALNLIWKHEPDVDRLRKRNFFIRRLLSLGFVIVIGFLLLLTMVISATLTTLGDVLNESILNQQLPQTGWLISFTSDFIVSMCFFTLVYRWLHDTRVTWKFASLGGMITALLFMLGKTLLALLLTHMHLGSAYGAAGSLAVLLAWCYYTSLAFLVGAEITRAIEAYYIGKAQEQLGASVEVSSVER
ncbi:YihY/virulence factor BrkB family protein [Aeoliella mucimassa]|uniref:Uncharacterized protein n=1 Tax=Aeoliella mucimassa TaxID=2527972 RepID=A0A518AMY7_9BACT|nr:YihY/virulence factor BrkB family protein [Aeoliella mucimassa]QDU56097.1 hypothetical protein Pan181_23010 [Aeoliella mucimassa]